MKTLAIVAVVVVLGACGDDPVENSSFELVGHSELGARGMNSALAVAGTTAYVGSRIDGAGGDAGGADRRCRRSGEPHGRR